jgi:hypothetical protein
MFWASSLILTYFVFVYVVKPTHLNGYDAIELLRKLPIWRYLSPVRVNLVAPGCFDNLNPDHRYIFVVIPNITNTALIWTFGLHGNAWFHGNDNRLCFLLPAIFFHIPILREILCLIGAVSDRHTIDATVVAMTQLGKNVAFAPNGMTDALYADDDSCYHAGRPPSAIFKLAVDRGYHIVPVLCTGENDKRFVFVTNERIKSIQSWCLSKLGYPFPLIFFPDLRNQLSDRRIDVQIGTPIYSRAEKYKHLAPETIAEELQKDFIKSLQQLNNNGVDKLIIFKE